MASRELRFAVRSEGRRAATWKLFGAAVAIKDDVYLACRELRGSIKFSLHESGHWHHAFEQHAYSSRVQGAVPSLPDRFIQRWIRPNPMGGGVTLALRIVTPAVAVTTPVASPEAGGIVWIPAAREGMATEVAIAFVDVFDRARWPGMNAMKTYPVGYLPLSGTKAVWVVHHEIPIPDFSATPDGKAQFFKGASSADLLAAANLRALAFAEAPDGSRIIYDTLVRPKPGLAQ